MATIPRVLIKKGTDAVKDIFTTYGLRTSKYPYILKPVQKNVATRKYYDQDGDYEYIPATPKYEALEFVIGFAYKGAANGADTYIKNFLDYIVGSEITIYSEFTKTGRAKCRVVTDITDSKFFRAGKDIVELDITFKTNDPNTNTALTLTV